MPQTTQSKRGATSPFGRADDPAGSKFKYVAFISYARADAKWAEWLHGALESYRIPKTLRKSASGIDAGPDRLGRVFRDKEELGASAVPDAQINAALESSQFMVVICSPNAVKSDWVNKEIRRFKMMGKHQDIFCLIVSGTPNASDDPANTDQECLPRAVRFVVDKKGVITTERADFVAPDVRVEADGKTDALLKLVSGMLGLGFDDLKRRHERQRAQVAARRTILLLSLAVALAGLATWALGERASARKALSISLLQQGVAQFEHGSNAYALAYLSQATRVDRRNYAATRSAVSIMSNSTFCTPACEPLKHPEEVADAEFSPDGTRVVTASGNRARIWDARSGKLLEELRHHYSLGYDGRYNAEGKRIRHAYLAAAGEDRVRRAMFSADGKRILTYGYRKICVWNAVTGRLVRQIETRDRSFGFNQSGVSDDGHKVAAPSGTNTSSVWDVETGKETVLCTQDSLRYGPIFSRDGGKLVTLGVIDAAIWDVRSGRRITELKHKYRAGCSDFGFKSACFCPDDIHLVTACSDFLIRLWDCRSGRVVRTMGGTREVRAVSASDDGRYILGLCSDAVRLYSTTSGRLLFCLARSTTPVASAIDPSGSRVAVSYNDNTVQLWDSRNGRQICEPINHPAIVTKVRFSPAANRLLTVCSDGKVLLWTLRSRVLPIVMRHRDKVDKLGFSDDGRILVTLAQSEFKQWSTGSRSPLCTYAHDSEYSNCTGYIRGGISGDRPWAYVISKDNVLWLWNTKSGELYARIPGPQVCPIFCTADFSTDSRFFACPSMDAKVVYLVDLKRMTAEELKHESPVTSLQFVGSTHHLLSVTSVGPAIVWDCDTGGCLHRIVHNASVYTAAVDRKGTRIATCSNLGNIRIWDAKTYRPVANLCGQGVGCRAAWLRNGNVVIASPSGSREFCRQGIRTKTIMISTFIDQPDGRKIVDFPEPDMDVLIWNPNKRVTSWEFTYVSGQMLPDTSKDGRLILRRITDADVAICETSTGRLLTKLHHIGTVSSAHFSADGKWIATACGNRVSMWDRDSGNLVSFMRHEKNVCESAFSKDGRWLATGSEDCTAKLWYLGEDPQHAPTWISDLMEAVAGVRIRDGMPVIMQDQFKALARAERLLEQSDKKNPWVRWGKWMLAEQPKQEFYMP